MPNYYYRGKLVDELTKEELIIAYKSAVDALERERIWFKEISVTRTLLTQIK